MRKLVSSLAVLFGCLGMSVSTFATSTYSGLTTVQYAISHQSGIVIFTIGSAPSSPWSTCNANHKFALNTANLRGHALDKTVITAQQQIKNVYVVGLGTCTLVNSSEDVNYVQINP
jgi:predicted amino acid racemase